MVVKESQNKRLSINCKKIEFVIVSKRNGPKLALKPGDINSKHRSLNIVEVF